MPVDWLRSMKNLVTAVLMTLVTTILLGLAYPLVVTGLAQVIFPDKADGQLIRNADGAVIGSRLIGQPSTTTPNVTMPPARSPPSVFSFWLVLGPMKLSVVV